MGHTAEEAVMLAGYAERAERFDEMTLFMEERVRCSPMLSTDERDLLSAAFKAAVNSRRHAIRTAVGQQHMAPSAVLQDHCVGYKSKMLNELREICGRAFGCLNLLLAQAEGGEPKVFYCKMMADYHRYVAEFADSDVQAQEAQQAQQMYITGTTEAQSTLAETNPVRLGLALNFSVFQHEVQRDTAAAAYTAKTALNAAMPNLQSMPPELQQDAILTCQLLQDNLTLWEADP